MTHILADPTEERYLPLAVREQCAFVSGLEDLTGADFIITRLRIPATTENLLLKHAASGLCIQRKEAGDFASSFQERDNRLWLQLIRMKEVTDFPALLLIGDVKCNHDQNAVIDGRETQLSYWSYLGALDAWQERGGYVSWISRDTLLADWIRVKYARLGVNGDEKPVARPVAQTLYEVPALVRTLMTFPGLGVEKAQAIYAVAADKVSVPSLQDCFVVLQDLKVDGVGKTLRDRALRYIGWNTEETP